MTDPDAVQQLATRARCTLGPIDLLVNAAGTNRAVGPDWELDPLARAPREHWAHRFFPAAAAGSADDAARLVVLLAFGVADALSGRYLSVADDLPAPVARAGEIRAADLLVLRLRTAPGT